jgi:hypothetical protein
MGTMENYRENTKLQSETPPRRLLGQVLVDGEFITHYDLERALEEQKRTSEMLGEVLVRTRVLDPVDLKAALSIQGELASVKDAIRTGAGVRMLLGELLLSARRITPEKLDAALEEQRRTGEKLGGILVRRGWLTENELDALLSFQKHQSDEAPISKKLRLGEILVETGQITREQLDRALILQKQTRKKIGELLVEAGDILPHQVTRGLAIQRKLVTAALVATLSLASTASAQAASPAGNAIRASSAKVKVSATIHARASIRIRHQTPTVVITGADIARGYVDVPAASRVEVRSNSPNGYLLVFEGMDGPDRTFREVTVRGLAREVQIGPGGGLVPQPHARGTEAMELGYRFILRKDARPGTYAWPLAVSTRPL